MIQDIAPAKMDITFRNIHPSENSKVLIFCEGKLLCRSGGEDGIFPEYKEIGGDAQYLFSIDEDEYFITFDFADKVAPNSYELVGLRDLRKSSNASKAELFAAFTAFHLFSWYESSRFCGKCGHPTEYDTAERAMVCPSCKNKIYPRINPAVIIGIKNADRLLITKYRMGYGHSALVAGFAEIGETLEDTVRREVMEEVGLKVKNINYYKSQPWGIAADLLAGFYCEVDGDDSINMDENELKFAQWVKREDIELQPDDISLTNEMMKRFKNGLE